jgi:NAD(P)H-nitrite reductase large subunit
MDTAQKWIEFSNGKKLPYQKALLAVGAAARKPSLPGIDLTGVVYLDSMETTKQTIKMSRGWKTAVVIGGGITALELVEGLAARGVKVHFFLRGSHYWGRVLDRTESAIVLHRLSEEGVKIHRDTEAQQIIGKNGKVKGVLTKDGRTIKCDLVGVAIGVSPRLGIAQASGLTVGRGIRVDEHFQTSQPDVYAAGDAAETYDRQLEDWVVDSLWGIAREQGYLAGLNMAGKAQPYLRQSPLNVTRLAGLTTTIIGSVGEKDGGEDDLAIVRGESETWQKVPDAIVYQNDFAVNRVRIMVGGNVLLGAVVMGDQTLSRPLEDLVRESVDISPIRQDLVRPDFDAGGTIIDFWERWKNETG